MPPVTEVPWSGSSPQARGTPATLALAGLMAGIIPAGAGNSVRRAMPARARRDHPRRRGELPTTIERNLEPMGSSPQARGTPGFRMLARVRRGIIPAGAGNSGARSCDAVIVGDHPRRRGELHRVRQDPLDDAGSSPQARGTHSAAGDRGALVGIIPAGAGNSSYARARRADGWDHPRRRGELVAGSECGGHCGGSSPQARGTPTPSKS